MKLVLDVVNQPRSTYYYVCWSNKKVSKDTQLIKAIDKIKQANKDYGYRRVTGELHNQGFTVNHKHVLRLMKQMDCLSRVYNRKVRKYNSYGGVIGKIAPNRLHRRFKTNRPYQKLVSDVSEFRYGKKTTSQRVYFSPVMDLFSGEILSFNISEHATVAFTVKPLREALNKIPKKAYRTTVHTDQGYQYQNKRWRKVLKQHRVFQSMSRKATCLDNAAMESFFHIMKAEVLDRSYTTKKSLIASMTQWIYYYNNRRIKNKLKGKSPIQYRKLALQSVA